MKEFYNFDFGNLSQATSIITQTVIYHTETNPNNFQNVTLVDI